MRHLRMKERFFSAMVAIFLVFMAITVLYPLVNTILIIFTESCKLNKEVKPSLRYVVENIKYVLSISAFKKCHVLRNSVLRTVLGTIIGMIGNTILAYILSRPKFPFKRLLTIFWIFAYVADSGIIPQIVLYRKLNLIRTFSVYIVPYIVNITYVLILRAYMESLPRELEESAQLDGAGPISVFTRIVLPQCKPLIAATGLLVASEHWNSWYDAMIYNRFVPELSVIQYELLKAISCLDIVVVTGSASDKSNTPNYIVYEILMVMSILPVIIALPFFQKHFMPLAEDLLFARKKHMKKAETK